MTTNIFNDPTLRGIMENSAAAYIPEMLHRNVEELRNAIS